MDKKTRLKEQLKASMGNVDNQSPPTLSITGDGNIQVGNAVSGSQVINGNNNIQLAGQLSPAILASLTGKPSGESEEQS